MGEGLFLQIVPDHPAKPLATAHGLLSTHTLEHLSHHSLVFDYLSPLTEILNSQSSKQQGHA